MSADWAKFSAGAIGNAEVVRAAYDEPTIHGVDWGSGPQRYKLSGDARLHPYQDLHAWSGRSVRLGWWLGHYARTGTRAVARRAAQVVETRVVAHGGAMVADE